MNHAETQTTQIWPNNKPTNLPNPNFAWVKEKHDMLNLIKRLETEKSSQSGYNRR
jgi:hypothetical protein